MSHVWYGHLETETGTRPHPLILKGDFRGATCICDTGLRCKSEEGATKIVPGKRAGGGD